MANAAHLASSVRPRGSVSPTGGGRRCREVAEGGEPSAGPGKLQEAAAGDAHVTCRAPQPLIGALQFVGPERICIAPWREAPAGALVAAAMFMIFIKL